MVIELEMGKSGGKYLLPIPMFKDMTLYDEFVEEGEEEEAGHHGFSQKLQIEDKSPFSGYRTFNEVKELAVHVRECRSEPRCQACTSSFRQQQQQQQEKQQEQEQLPWRCRAGRGTVIEVLGIRIKDSVISHVIARGGLYGTIALDSFYTEYLYDREFEDRESIPMPILMLKGDDPCALLLNGPIHYFDSYAGGSLYTNISSLCSTRTILATHTSDWIANRPFSMDCGPFSVGCINIDNGVIAKVEVILVDTKLVAEGLFGLITARNALCKDVMLHAHYDNLMPDKYQTVRVPSDSSLQNQLLFRRRLGNSIKVLPGERIPLSRCLLTSRQGSFFTITAQLYDDHSQGLSSFHDYKFNEIAAGVARFDARCGGVFSKCISGRHGKIEIKVSW